MGNQTITNLQIIAETIASVINLDVEIVDTNLRRIAATGNMAKTVGAVQQSGWLNKKVLNTGHKIVIVKPGHDNACDGCQFIHQCTYQMGMLEPIVCEGKVIGVINFVAFNDKQYRAFKTKQDIYQKFLSVMAQLLTTDILSVVDPARAESAAAGIVENLNKGMITVENEGKISYVSERAKRILDKYNLLNSLAAVQEAAVCTRRKRCLTDLVGKSPKLDLVKEQINILADQDTSVMIQGESGTGKELVARIIHDQGRRSQYPFVDVNCAALPENLVESELFGYVDGSFTGARRGGSIGKVEYAHKGTLFLDEIGDMPLHVQTKLLRVLEEHEIYRIGSNKPIPVDIRVITATNKNLWEMVQQGKFRKDLFYRINVASLQLPRLAERKEDIPELIKFYVNHYCKNTGKMTLSVDDKVMQKFIKYEWQGNVRELRNVVEYCVVFCKGNVINPDCLPCWFTASLAQESECLDNYKDSTEKEFLLQAYRKYGCDKREMAKALNIGLTTLYRKLNKYHIE